MWTKQVVCWGLLIAGGWAAAGCNTNSPIQPAPGTCTYTLTPTSLAFEAAGGASSITITAATGCAWSATADRDWLTIVSGATGTGSGVVTIGVGENRAEEPRSGTVAIAGHSVVVTEAGLGSCTVELAPPGASHTDDSGTGEFSVRVPDHCAWTATSDSSWIRILAGATGTGGGTVTYAVERNLQSSSRTGHIAIGTTSFTIEQVGDAPPPSCEYAVTPIAFAPCMSISSTLMAELSTQAGCSWTATAGAPWITVNTGQSGTGPGVISFTVADNWEGPRSGVVMVRWPTQTAGQNLQVSQAGCFYAVSASAITVAASAGTGRFDVIQVSEPITCGGPTQSACLWTAVSDVPWIAITTSMPQFGDNPVDFTVAENPASTPRTGRITVRDKVVQIVQSGR